MRWITTIAREVWRLFVDDGSFALAILVWPAVVWLVLSQVAAPSMWRGLVLFAGLALILIWGDARRTARRRSRPRPLLAATTSTTAEWAC